MKFSLLTLSAVLAAALAAPAHAQSVDVKDAWVRATVPGQAATGAFMQISSPRPAPGWWPPCQSGGRRRRCTRWRWTATS